MVSHYQKLFDKSEIEYITPFLKLWMSFNNWYKQDLTDVRTDREAIDSYKESGAIKTEFLRLFTQNSEEGLMFQNALFDLILNLKNYDLKDKHNNSANYKVNIQGTETELILENATRRGGKVPIFISSEKKRFQILEENKELFFKQTLEIIYTVRNALVHGNFDIENIYFLNLVESSYKILYPIMKRILETQEESE